MRWLKEFVTLDEMPMRAFTEAITMSGSKVEGWEKEGSEIENVVVGQVLKLERHPDSDHLWICQIDVGAGEPLQIVTGAQNLQENDFVPVALHNSMLPGGKKIKKGKLRGVESNGMLCSLGELGLTQHDFPNAIEDGIFVLGDDCDHTLGKPICEAIGFDDTKVDERSNKTAREYMRQVVALCRSYVEHFGEHKDNLLFTGKTGLGKTFLSNCIAKELLDQSYSVVYLPAVEMYEIFSKERFDYDSTEEDRDRSRYLLDCDLLIIDDLGTELVNTFTTSQLFYCINERLNRRKGTIISTNLPVNEMRDEFTDRVMSRIVSQYTVIPLYGEDLRIRKKLMQARRQ